MLAFAVAFAAAALDLDGDVDARDLEGGSGRGGADVAGKDLFFSPKAVVRLAAVIFFWYRLLVVLVVFRGGETTSTHGEAESPLLLQVPEAAVNDGADGAAEPGAHGHEAAVHGVGDIGRAGQEDHCALRYGVDLSSVGTSPGTGSAKVQLTDCHMSLARIAM